MVDWLSVAVLIVFEMCRRMLTRFTRSNYLMIHLLMNTNIILNDLYDYLTLIVLWGIFFYSNKTIVNSGGVIMILEKTW